MMHDVQFYRRNFIYQLVMYKAATVAQSV